MYIIKFKLNKMKEKLKKNQIKMDKNKIERIIKEYIKKNYLMGQDVIISNNDSLTQTGVIDSIGVLELVDFLCKKFDVEIPESMLLPEYLDSIHATTELIYKLKMKGGKL